jgi:hypothetical protein
MGLCLVMNMCLMIGDLTLLVGCHINHNDMGDI